MSAISNSSPLIYTASLGDLDLIHKLFGRIAIPEAVFREVVDFGEGKPGADAVAEAGGSWLAVEKVRNRAHVERLMESDGLVLRPHDEAPLWGGL